MTFSSDTSPLPLRHLLSSLVSLNTSKGHQFWTFAMAKRLFLKVLKNPQRSKVYLGVIETHCKSKVFFYNKKNRSVRNTKR